MMAAKKVRSIAGRWTMRLILLVAGTFVLSIAALHVLAGRMMASREEARPGVEFLEVPGPDGTPIATYSIGPRDAGTTVVLIHGTPGTHDAFGDLLDTNWPEDFRVVSYDRPGFGKSPGDRAVAGLSAQTEALLALLHQLGSKRTFLLGHSYGAPIALDAAARAPERVSGVVLLGGSVGAQFENPLWIQYVGLPSLIGAMLPKAADQSNVELLRLETDLEELDGRLQEVEAPVLVLHGDQDDLVPVGNATWLKERWTEMGKQQKLQVKIYEDRNHFIPWTEPELLRKDVLEFVHEHPEK